MSDSKGSPSEISPKIRSELGLSDPKNGILNFGTLLPFDSSPGSPAFGERPWLRAPGRCDLENRSYLTRSLPSTPFRSGLENRGIQSQPGGARHVATRRRLRARSNRGENEVRSQMQVSAPGSTTGSGSGGDGSGLQIKARCGVSLRRGPTTWAFCEPEEPMPESGEWVSNSKKH